MKHLKNYENYINEAHEHGFSILGIFSSIFNKIKLSSLIHDYDDYLYDTYMNYISKVHRINANKLKQMDIQVVNNNNELLYDDNEIDLGDVDNETQPQSGDNSSSGNANTKTAKDIIYVKSKNHETDNFIELMNDYMESNDIKGLKELRKEYVDEYNTINNQLDLIKNDLTNYNKFKKKCLEDIINYDKKSSEYKKLDDKIKSYNNEILKLSDKIKKMTDDLDISKWYVDETSKVINYLESLNKSTNESIKTKNGVWVWSAKDIENVTKMINPYQIEEFHLKANTIIDNSLNPEKNKKKWDIYLNSLYKKWYNTYEIGELKNFNKKNVYTPKSKEEKRIKKENAYKSLIIEELYDGSETHIYNFKSLKEDKKNYFILSTNDSFFITKKILFNDDVFSFQLIASLKSDKSNKETLLVSKFMNNDSKNMILKINDKKIALYKKENEYPIFFIKDGIMYGTTDMINFEKSSLKNNTIYSLKDEHVIKIIKASNINYKPMKPSTEIVDKIKNINLK